MAHHLDETALDRAFEALADFRCAFMGRSVELYHHDDDGVWRAVDSFALGGDVSSIPGFWAVSPPVVPAPGSGR